MGGAAKKAGTSRDAIRHRRASVLGVDFGEQAIHAGRTPVLSLSDRLAPPVIVAIEASRSAVRSDTSSSGPNPRLSARDPPPGQCSKALAGVIMAAGSAHPRPK